MQKTSVRCHFPFSFLLDLSHKYEKDKNWRHNLWRNIRSWDESLRVLQSNLFRTKMIFMTFWTFSLNKDLMIFQFFARVSVKWTRQSLLIFLLFRWITIWEGEMMSQGLFWWVSPDFRTIYIIVLNVPLPVIFKISRELEAVFLFIFLKLAWMGGSRESNGEYEKIFNGVRYLGSVGINRRWVLIKRSMLVVVYGGCLFLDCTSFETYESFNTPNLYYIRYSISDQLIIRLNWIHVVVVLACFVVKFALS